MNQEDWRVRAKKIKILHEERQKEHGEAKIGRPDSVVGKRGWGVRQTAEELQLNVRYIIEDLKLAEYLDDPRFEGLNRNEALEKLDGKPRATKEIILVQGLTVALAKLNSNLNSAREVRELLKDTLRKYEQRNSSGSKKD